MPKGANSTKPKPRKKTTPTPGLSARIGNHMPELGATFAGAFSINLEFVGAAAALVGLITTWAALAGDANGVLVKGVDDALDWPVGRAAYVVPVVLFGVAFQCFRKKDGPVLRWQQILGAVGFVVATTGLTYAATSIGGEADGGVVGKFVFDLGISLVGDLALGFALLGIGAASIFLLTGVSPRELYGELRRIAQIVYKPLPPVEDTDVFDIVPSVAAGQAAAISVHHHQTVGGAKRRLQLQRRCAVPLGRLLGGHARPGITLGPGRRKSGSDQPMEPPGTRRQPRSRMADLDLGRPAMSAAFAVRPGP